MSDIYAISDLHLGGAAPSDGKPGFQMCSERGRERLAEFIRHIRTRHLSPGVSYPLAAELIINGDFIDFLAEQPFEAVTVDEESARRKLVSVMQNLTSSLCTTASDFNQVSSLACGGTFSPTRFSIGNLLDWLARR